MSESVEISDTSPAPKPTAQPALVMQIIVRRDLLDAEGWGVGPLMAQVAHATSAVLHETRERPETQAYLGNLKNMRKTANQASIERLASLLAACEPPVPHHLWVELPENIPTCLALAPNLREPKIKKALDKAGCRLWRA
ncbi:hypothetical protein TRAPUB_3725 [Trametes pubescens]|uniref:peptidyl-tRNA hydrolase n=1 Tax=Trametes pubescens TaxID=154538 RepID=A0A1M2VD10_TRAPU|nr:hypothetical protein TRAPUB_3725 [Trametes pubescens]